MELDLNGKLIKKHTVLDGIKSAEVRSMFRDIEDNFLIEADLYSNDRIQVYEEGRWVVHTASKDRKYLSFDSNKGLFGYINSKEERVKICINDQWQEYQMDIDWGELNEQAVLDNENNLWVSYENGVVKHDGKSSKVYQFMKKYKDPVMLLKDKSDNLWARSFFDDWYHYDRKKDSWSICESDTCKLIKNSRFAFSDSKQNIWFTNDKGNVLYKYNGTKWNEITVPFRDLSKDWKARHYHDWLHCGVEDKFGNLWFGTYYGNLYKYDGKDWTFINLSQPNPYFYDGSMRSTVIHQAVDKSVWIAGWDYVSKLGMDEKDNQFLDRGAITRDGKAGFHYGYQATNSLIEDGLGNLYINPQQGVFKYDKELAEWSYILRNQDISFMYYNSHDSACYFLNNKGMLIRETDGGEITFRQVVQMEENKGYVHYDLTHVDRLGALWLVAKDTLMCIRPDTTLVFDGSNSPFKERRPYYLYEDSQGRIWMNRKGGVTYWNGKKWISFTELNSPISGLYRAYGRGNCYPIAEDKDGNIFFSTGSSVFRWDGVKWMTHRRWEEALKNRNARGNLFFDSKNNMWILGQGGNITKCEGADCKQIINRFKTTYLDVIEDSQGRIWFLTDEGGLFRYTN